MLKRVRINRVKGGRSIFEAGPKDVLCYYVYLKMAQYALTMYTLLCTDFKSMINIKI